MSPKATKDKQIEVLDTNSPVVVQLFIARELYDEYQRLAILQDLSVAELMQHRLTRCVSHSSIRPIYFNDSQRAQLEGLLQKKPLETAEQTLPLLLTALEVRVDNVSIPLTAAQARRLQHAGYGKVTPAARLTQIIQSAVQRDLGV